jgi:hypothetical protein
VRAPARCRRRYALLAALAVLGCGGGGDRAEEPRAQPPQYPGWDDEPPTESPRAGRPGSRCSRVSPALLRTIGSRLTVAEAGLRRAYLVGDEGRFAVAAEVDGRGLERPGDIGVWTTTRREGGGDVRSVNRTARALSAWQAGGVPAAGAGAAEDAEACSRAGHRIR